MNKTIDALVPRDEHNLQLEQRVHPPQWVNPRPDGKYHLVVIGAGTAGLVTAAGAAGLGARVALVERSLMGGDCLNFGCVPSKALISAARRARAVRESEEYGIRGCGHAAVDFPAVMRRLRNLRTRISVNDSAERFRDLGVDVFFGAARFVDSETVDVDGTQLRFKKAVIATGARAAAPPIRGLETVEYLTNETLFSLTELPQKFGVIGAGPIGCEMAQAFAQLGSKVVLVEAEHGVLPREDRDAAGLLQQSMESDGVRVLCCGKELEVRNESGIRLSVESHERTYDETVDQLLVAVGRKPNIEGLGLDAVGVDFDEKGVRVNDRLQTSNPRIFAAGDICSRYQFTHAADFMARIVIQNALFFGRKKASSLVIPWCTYTTPEVARVGVSEREAKSQGMAVDVFQEDFSDVDRAVLEGEDDGFVRILTRKGSDTIVGSTIVSARAGDLICEVTLAMTHGIGLAKIGSVIHPYPTFADAVRRLGDQYNRSRLTPLARKLLAWWLR